MRQLKFRAYFHGQKIMENGASISFDGCESEYVGNMQGFDEKITIMQFTGLHDKNGKEIYEGDILRWVSSNPFSLGEIRKVQVSYVEARYWCHGSIGVYLADLLSNERCEVIGNIYENPELIN